MWGAIITLRRKVINQNYASSSASAYLVQRTLMDSNRNLRIFPPEVPHSHGHQVSEAPPRSLPVPTQISQRSEVRAASARQRELREYGSGRSDTTHASTTCEVDSVGGRLRAGSSRRSVFCERIAQDHTIQLWALWACRHVTVGVWPGRSEPRERDRGHRKPALACACLLAARLLATTLISPPDPRCSACRSAHSRRMGHCLQQVFCSSRTKKQQPTGSANRFRSHR